jgi:hypothetical protein
MVNISETAMASSELGTLWMTYEIKSLMDKMIENMVIESKDSKAKKILEDHIKENKKLLDEIKGIFNKEKAVVPIAFGEYDVFNDAPALFDDIFHIMFLRIMMKINLGFNAVHLGMSYRNDIRKFYESTFKNAQDTYGICTDYLTKQGVLSKPPYVTMPKEVEFIEETKYMSGIQMFRNKRSLNSLEVAYLYQAIEVNVFGMQLMTGFAQVAKESEIKNYFVKGKELAKEIVSGFSKVFLDSDIQPPTTWAGKATDSVIPPFSDKIMMYCTNIMSSYAVGNNALGMSFSMRSDLPLKLAFIAKDALDYAREGGKLMIKHKWLEEPPQMEDRNQLIKGKKSLLPL